MAIGDLAGIYSLPGNAIFLAGPFVEIDQFASFGTEWPPGIVFPLYRLPARRTFGHMAKVRRKTRKVKVSGTERPLAGIFTGFNIAELKLRR